MSLKTSENFLSTVVHSSETAKQTTNTQNSNFLNSEINEMLSFMPKLIKTIEFYNFQLKRKSFIQFS